MNYFINLKHGVASLDTYRLVNAQLSDMTDVINQCHLEETETLTVSLDLYIEQECKRVVENIEFNGYQFDTIEQLRDYLLGEEDFLDYLNYALDIDHIEFPDLRQLQKDEYSDFVYSLFPDDML